MKVISPVRIFMLALTLLCGGFGTHAACAQGFVRVVPQDGEVQISGSVQKVEASRNQFVLLVTQVLADGKTRLLTAAKPKIVVVSQSTTWGVLGMSLVPPLDAVAKLTAGQPLVVIGRSIAAGQITARLICIITTESQIPEEKPQQASDPPGKNLLLPTDRAENWQVTLLDPAQGSVEAEDGAIKVSVAAASKEDWRVQLAQTGAFPEPGVSYTLSFRARATPPRKMRVSAQVQGSDFHDIGINRIATVGDEWNRYEYTFVTRDLGAKGHFLPVFFFGTQKGDTYLADVSVSPSLPEQQGNLLEAVSNPAAWKLVALGKENLAFLRINGTLLEVGTSAAAKPTQENVYQLVPLSPAELVPGRRYVLRFRARSGTPRILKIRGSAEPILLGPEEKDYTVRLDVTRLTDFGACPTFSFASQPGTFTLSSLVLCSEKWANAAGLSSANTSDKLP